jgi:serine/threonine protein kinase
MDEISLLPTKYARYIYKERASEDDQEEDGGPAKEYHIQKTLGAGNFASVKLAICKSSGSKFALKCIDRKKMVGGSARAEAVRDEINILQSVSHPNIIKIHKNYETDSTIFLVLELVEGGELFDFIVKRGDQGLAEGSAREIFRQIVDAVAYLHNQGISHRDLKLRLRLFVIVYFFNFFFVRPENILLGKQPVDDSGPFVVKLSDFGLSRLVGQSNLMQTMCGTPSYLAPEVLSQGSYGVSCDVWSMGVVLYILISGRHPFDESSNGVLDRIKRADYSMDDRVWQDASAEVMDCIRRCLVADPATRITAAQLLEHPFLTGKPMPAAVFAVPLLPSASSSNNNSPKNEAKPLPAEAAVVAAAEPVAKKAKKLEDGALPVCKYGQQCFRKNPQHFKEFAHPWLDK